MPRHDALSSQTDLVPAAEFSVREFTSTARGSHRAELHLDAFATDPLDPATLDLVSHLAELERGALTYLRSVLVTPTHKDGRVTAFLVTWAFEKFWIADALELVVSAHPDFTPPEWAPTARERARLEFAERFEPIRESVVTNLIGEDVIAVHMITAALDEWIIETAYTRLIEGTGSAALARILGELLEVKQRHGAFFSAQARDRLARSGRAGRLARRRLARTVFPLGSAHQPPSLTGRLLGEVLEASDLAALDTRLSVHPGLAGLHPVADALARVTTPGKEAQ